MLAKLFDASFDRKHEARCARRTILCSLQLHTDKWSSLRSKFAIKVKNWPHCHYLFRNTTIQPFQLLYEAIYVEYRMTWLIFEIAMHGSWTKCWVFFSIFFNLPPPPPSQAPLCFLRCSILYGAPYYTVLHTIWCSILYGAPYSTVLPSVAHTKWTFISDIYFGLFFVTYKSDRRTDKQTDI